MAQKSSYSTPASQAAIRTESLNQRQRRRQSPHCGAKVFGHKIKNAGRKPILLPPA